eukprot:CAMPEP_0180767932 /NCGR_PEP_ID=MMETSP1038_2-20121128/40288_1 /TAXON_ID=632150 /ORGANISM="Azadinium spinosum, Strain 3D9" /LENGTH=43 /DNA_ID= /DNA_START= /DNA_END= /DNA_ORIENTATION=
MWWGATSNASASSSTVLGALVVSVSASLLQSGGAVWVRERPPA